MGHKESTAVKTLELAGYTYNYANFWKPPLGPSAAPMIDKIDMLEEENQMLLRVIGGDKVSRKALLGEIDRLNGVIAGGE